MTICARCSQLEARAARLEEELARLKNSQSPARSLSSNAFDFSRYARRKIALKFGYDGSKYCGLALQTANTPLPTVEEKLLDALVQARLIEHRDLERIGFSRCGRTDKGVSAAGQVVSLWVRSALPRDELPEEDLAAGQDVTDPHTHAQSTIAPVGSVEGELQYAHLLNRILPHSIRILSWSPVHAAFSARFSCTGRHYKYFFRAREGELDIDAMRDAAARLMGVHDFRNFCKLDGSKQITNYVRTVTLARIYKYAHGPTNMYGFELAGSAFLWHQVRHIMAILFHVGAGWEEPAVINDLLDIDLMPSKPSYEMAEALPLMLYECTFTPGSLRWQPVQDQTFRNVDSASYELDVRAMLAIERASVVMRLGMKLHKASRLQCGAGETIGISKEKYKPLVERSRGPTFEEVNARWRLKREASMDES